MFHVGADARDRLCHAAGTVGSSGGPPAPRIVELPVPLIYLEEERSFGGMLDDGDTRLKYYHQVLRRSMQSAGMLSADIETFSAIHPTCRGGTA